MILQPTWLVVETDPKKLQSDNVFYILVRHIDKVLTPTVELSTVHDFRA